MKGFKIVPKMTSMNSCDFYIVASNGDYKLIGQVIGCHNKRFRGKMLHISGDKHGIFLAFCHTNFVENQIFWIRKKFICC